MNENECLRKDNYVGFAHVYLAGCKELNEYEILREEISEKLTRRDLEKLFSELFDGIDKELYSELVELDTRLGTTASEQLFNCVFNTLNLDIIKV